LIEESVATNPEPAGATTEALAELYEAAYPRFLRVAEAVVRDEQLAKDVVQEGFARAIQFRLGFSGTASLEAWVWRIVLNVARGAASERVRSAVSMDEPPEQIAPERGSDDGGLRAAIAGLSERQRLVLFLRYYADLDYRAIAEVLQIESGTVGATLNQ